MKRLLYFFHFLATLAQLVEQLTRNEQVVGSTPTGGSKYRTGDFPPFPLRGTHD